jgi:hypothetical protein
MYIYPSFFNIADDIDNLLYYTYDIPNYYKLYDFINAIINVYDIKINKHNFDIIEIFSVIHTSTPKNIDINKKVNKNKTEIKQIAKPEIKQIAKPEIKPEIKQIAKPEINFEAINEVKNEEKLGIKIPENINKTNNAFIELNIENSDNYALITDINHS